MEPSTSDESAGRKRGGWLRDAAAPDQSVAVADPPPSMTAAHWANRDNEASRRRPGGTGTFRRPPAENSFPEEDGANAMPRRLPSQQGGAGGPYDTPSPYAQIPQQYEPASQYDTGQQQYEPAPQQYDAGQQQYDVGQQYDAAQQYGARMASGGFGPADGTGAEVVDDRTRHWTAIGTETRRPRTSDRGEVSTPPIPAHPTSGGGASMPGGQSRGMQVAQGSPGGPVTVGGSITVGGPPSGFGPGAARRNGGRRPAGSPGGVAAAPSGSTLPFMRQSEQPAEVSADSGGLLGGPGRDIRPHRANGAGAGKPGVKTGKAAGTKAAKDTDRAAVGTTDSDDERPRSRALSWTVLVLSIVAMLAAGAAALAVFTGKPAALASMLGKEDVVTGTTKAAVSLDASSVTAPLGGRTTATFEMVTGTNLVTMTSDDLGDDLYRITSAADSGTVPNPVVDGDRVQLLLARGGTGNTANVSIVLTNRVRWSLRFTGGADEQRVDMSKGQVGAVEVLSGGRRFDLTLPPANGTVGIRVAGALEELAVAAPKESPVRVQLDSGAKTVAARDKTRRDVAPGSTFTPKDWDTENRYDVEAAARVTLLSITTTE